MYLRVLVRGAEIAGQVGPFPGRMRALEVYRDEYVSTYDILGAWLVDETGRIIESI
jgi:hypothetical protein